MENQVIIERFNYRYNIEMTTLEGITEWLWARFKPPYWIIEGSRLSDKTCLTQHEYEQALKEKYIKLATIRLKNGEIEHLQGFQEITEDMDFDINDDDLAWIKPQREYNLTPFTKNTIAN